MNESLKIITKGVNNRLSEVVEDLIDKTQTAFMKNRFIMEGVVVLHEILHEVKKKKMSGVLFKVDFKNLGQCELGFSLQYYGQEIFSHKINDLIFSIITSGKVNIKLNDKLGTYFKTKRGVRQGDPLFPILFNLTVDSMSSLVKNAQENGLIRGLAPHLQENGFSIL
jgi:hypothetical protein